VSDKPRVECAIWPVSIYRRLNAPSAFPFVAERTDKMAPFPVNTIPMNLVLTGSLENLLHGVSVYCSADLERKRHLILIIRSILFHYSFLAPFMIHLSSHDKHNFIHFPTPLYCSSNKSRRSVVNTSASIREVPG
jgi:hypothetical protein